LSLLQWGAVIGASLAGAAFDVRSQRIPNKLTFPVLVAGLLWALLAGSWLGLVDALAGCVVLGAPFVLLWLFAGGGAGDAKLMGALGAWLGMGNGVVTLVAVVLAGALWGIAFAVRSGTFRDVLARMQAVVTGLLLPLPVRDRFRMAVAPVPNHDEMVFMPYGIAIFSGVCVAALGVHLWSL
jgi:prepilin peptidase CpaA